jgi:hypothetical protein
LLNVSNIYFFAVVGVRAAGFVLWQSQTTRHTVFIIYTIRYLFFSTLLVVSDANAALANARTLTTA